MFFTLQGDQQVGTLDNTRWNAGPMMTYVDSNKDGSLVSATSSASNTVYAFSTTQGKLVSTVKVGETPKGNS